MCGIAGFVNDMPIDVKCPVLQRMTDMIAHRGPDSEGHYIDEHAALGHRRLSIIDLGGGQQPRIRPAAVGPLQAHPGCRWY